jgi:hypothetical protein
MLSRPLPSGKQDRASPGRESMAPALWAFFAYFRRCTQCRTIRAAFN